MTRWKKDDDKLSESGERMRQWIETDAGKAYKVRSTAYAKNWRKQNPEYAKAIQQRSYDKIRRECFEHYGNGIVACRCCGESELKFLHLDHKDGDGAERRREWEKTKSTAFGGTGFYYWLKKNDWPDLGLQILCANCNLGKRTGKYCPHELHRGIDMDGNVIPVEYLPKEFPKVTRRLRGEAVKEAVELGLKPATLRMRKWREKNPLPVIVKPESTHCKNGHAYAEENLYSWKGHRQCRQCKRDYKARKKEQQ